MLCRKFELIPIKIEVAQKLAHAAQNGYRHGCYLTVHYTEWTGTEELTKLKAFIKNYVKFDERVAKALKRVIKVTSINVLLIWMDS